MISATVWPKVAIIQGPLVPYPYFALIVPYMVYEVHVALRINNPINLI